MGKFHVKFYFVFILSLFHFTTSYINSDEGCTVFKTLQQAGFVCASTDLGHMNNNLELQLKKVTIIDPFIEFFVEQRQKKTLAK